MARRTASEIASDNAEQAAKVYAKAEARVSKAQEEVQKAQDALPRSRRMLDHVLSHPDLPEDVRVRLTPASDQEEIPVPESASSAAVQRDGASA